MRGLGKSLELRRFGRVASPRGEDSDGRSLLVCSDEEVGPTLPAKLIKKGRHRLVGTICESSGFFTDDSICKKGQPKVAILATTRLGLIVIGRAPVSPWKSRSLAATLRCEKKNLGSADVCLAVPSDRLPPYVPLACTIGSH
jgi:hypothetical protein